MKKELRAALETVLAERLPAVLGAQYGRLRRLPKGEGYLTCQGEIVFADVSSAPIARFISFIPDQKRSAFTVELGWSTDGQFPRASARPNAHPATVISRRLIGGFVRLTELYTGLGEDWDVTPSDPWEPTSVERLIEFQMRHLAPDEAGALLRPLVEDALFKLQKYAAPFFDSISAGAPMAPEG